MKDGTTGPTMFRPTGRIPNKLRAALGLIVIHFSMLEWKIEQTIWALRKNPRKIGRQYTRRKRFNARIEALKTALRKHFRDFDQPTTAGAKFYSGAITLAERLARSRNLCVHGLWSKGTIRGNKRKYFVLSYFDKEEGESWTVDENALRDFNNDLVDLIVLLDRGAPEFLGKPLP